MATTLIEAMARGEAPPYVPLNVDQYHDLMRAGVLPEGAPIELIDGMLVYKDRRDDPRMPLVNHGPNHANGVAALARLLDRLVEPLGCHARCQLPVTLPPGNEPEPDVSVIKGEVKDYGQRLPKAVDTWAVFEVADSSLASDRSTKLRIYSEAGIPTYAILDLVAKAIEVYTSPVVPDGRYDNCETFGRDDDATIDVAGQPITFAVDDVLP